MEQMTLVALMTAMMASIDLRKLCPKEKDLSRIVYPQQHNDQRAGCAITGGDGGAANVKADQQLANGEQEGGDDRANQYVMPFNIFVWKYFVDSAEKQRDEAE